MADCKQCKRTLPDTSFYPMRSRRWRVRICNDCAHENMRRYLGTKWVGREANEVKEVNE